MNDAENYWGENERFPLQDWKLEVSENNTRLGYWDWVQVQIGYAIPEQKEG